uniref:Uncharacterized protein n=1 Tax=Panagrolaimus sp. ES5 TaxID=591445 RepID=A0AC34FVL0_9BILA
MDDIVGIVNHPHEYKKVPPKLKLNESKDFTSSSSDDENPVWKEGKRFHKIHRSPINSHVWAVLVLEDDNQAVNAPQSSYTVSHKLLIPANEL